MKKTYVYPFLEVQEINTNDMLLVSGVFGEVDENEVVDQWPW